LYYEWFETRRFFNAIVHTRGVQTNLDVLKFNGTNQLLVYADEVNILAGSVHTIEKNTDAFVVAIKESVLEIILIKLSTWIRDQNAGQSQKKKTYNSSFERVEEFKYW
jgi:hypothetical protein